MEQGFTIKRVVFASRKIGYFRLPGKCPQDAPVIVGEIHVFPHDMAGGIVFIMQIGIDAITYVCMWNSMREDGRRNEDFWG
jgi:hypothetical protein